MGVSNLINFYKAKIPRNDGPEKPLYIRLRAQKAMRNEPLERSLTEGLGVASSMPRLFSRSVIDLRPPNGLSWTPGRNAFGRTLEQMVDALAVVVDVVLEAVVCSGSEIFPAALVFTPYLSAEALRILIAVITPFGCVGSRLGAGVRMGCGGLGMLSLSGLDSW